MRKKSCFLISELIMLWLLFSLPAPLASAIEESDEKTDIEALSLEELLNVEITTASKKAEKLHEAPGIITVITQNEIRGFAGQNLGEILRRVVGVNWLSPDVFPNQSIVFRAQETTPYNNHVLILLNGRPVRDPTSGGNNATIWKGFPIDAIEQIEIIRGPGSVLYGSLAFSAAINIKTIKPTEDGFRGRGWLGMGSYKEFSQGVSASHKTGKFYGTAAVRHLQDEGPVYEFTDYNGLKSSDQFYNKNLGAVARLEYAGLSMNVLFSDYNPYSLDGGEYWNPGYYGQHKALHLDIGYHAAFGPKFSLEANFTYNRHIWNTGKGGSYSSNYGESPLVEANGRLELIKDLNIIFGGGYEGHSWGEVILAKNSRSSHFIYSQWDYRIGDAVKLIGGFQYNKVQNSDGHISPRLGAIINLNAHMAVKMLYSEAFRKAYANEMAFNVIVFRGNMELKPEIIRTWEAQLLYFTNQAQLSLTYYNSHIVDMITRQYFPSPGTRPPFYLKYLNGGVWDFQGLEFEGKYSVNRHFFVTMNALYQSNRNEAGQEDANLHANFMLKFGLLYSVRQFSIGLYDAFFGEPHQTSMVNPASKIVNVRPRAYHWLSARIAYSPDIFTGRKALTLSLEGQNLLGNLITYPDYPNKRVNSLLPLSPGATWLGKIIFSF